MNIIVSDQKAEFSQLAEGNFSVGQKNRDLSFAKGIIYNFIFSLSSPLWKIQRATNLMLYAFRPYWLLDLTF